MNFYLGSNIKVNFYVTLLLGGIFFQNCKIVGVGIKNVTYQVFLLLEKEFKKLKELLLEQIKLFWFCQFY